MEEFNFNLDSEDDFEVLESDLMLLEEPNEFSTYLYSLHEEIEIYDIKDLYDFFNSLGWVEHCIILKDFEKRIINE